MPNFYDENPDIRLNLDLAPLTEIAKLREGDFAAAATCPYAPASAEDALDNYHDVLSIVGGITGDFIAPRAEDIDANGPTLEDGVVTYAKGTQEALDCLGGADMMGFTLPRKYGGINLPHTIYAVANEMVSRADTGLMTLVGLQDIGETILRFADDDLKDKYLPRFASGEATGAMALTEPDAGSDLQAVRLKATPDPDEEGLWRLNGVKRFITNGCGDILLVLARSEEGSVDGRGLSLFVAEKCPDLRVRRIEEKLGIHSSPTCELQFNNVKAYLVGRRRRGLVKYTMDLMNGARLAIAAQSVGLCEAAYREAIDYAREREQFGKAILHFPAVAEILVQMKLKLQLARIVTVDCAVAVDFEKLYEEQAENHETAEEYKPLFKKWTTFASALTPMAKYYASEAAITLSNNALQVLGGSGYMRDYPVERLLRDARITNIYEGTSQLQVVAILASILRGGIQPRVDELAANEHGEAMTALKPAIDAAYAKFAEAVDFVRERGDREYTDFCGRHLADMLIDVYHGYRLLDFGDVNEEKATLARIFVPSMTRRIHTAHNTVLSGDKLLLEQYTSLLAD